MQLALGVMDGPMECSFGALLAVSLPDEFRAQFWRHTRFYEAYQQDYLYYMSALPQPVRTSAPLCVLATHGLPP